MSLEDIKIGEEVLSDLFAAKNHTHGGTFEGDADTVDGKHAFEFAEANHNHENVGNADTVDGKHASEFAAHDHDHDSVYVKKEDAMMYDTGWITIPTENYENGWTPDATDPVQVRRIGNMVLLRGKAVCTGETPDVPVIFVMPREMRPLIYTQMEGKFYCGPSVDERRIVKVYGYESVSPNGAVVHDAPDCYPATWEFYAAYSRE